MTLLPRRIASQAVARRCLALPDQQLTLQFLRCVEGQRTGDAIVLARVKGERVPRPRSADP